MVVNSMSGTLIVQDPDECESREMPESALKHAQVDYVRKAEAIGPLLVELVTAPGSSGEAATPAPLTGGVDELESIVSEKMLPQASCPG